MNLPKPFFSFVAKSLGLALIGSQVYAEPTPDTTNQNGGGQSAVVAEAQAAPPVQPQQTTAEDYASQITVEIIAFQRLLDSSSLNQTFPELSTVIPTADAILPAETQINARSLANSQMQLNDIFTKFEQHDAYVPFYHQAWTQELNQQSLALPIHIQSDPNSIPALDGRFMVWQDDKIELSFNLAFSYNSNQAELPPTQAFGSVEQDVSEVVPDIDAVASAQETAATDSTAAAARHTIQYQSQSSYTDNQMMYFDHPLFGILVLINSADGKPLKGISSNGMAQ